jgi:hypothetical protein
MHSIENNSNLILPKNLLSEKNRYKSSFPLKFSAMCA